MTERASASYRVYAEEIDWMEQAVAKEEQIVSIASQHADEAKAKWKDAIAELENADIAKILNGTINLEDYEGDYRAAIEKAIQASEEKSDADKELEDAEKSLEETRKESFEKAMEYLEAQLGYIEEIKATIESEMDLINATGGLIIEAQYEDLIDQNEKVIDQYQEQIDLIEDRISEVDEESADYYELRGQLEKCTQEINNAKAETAEWVKTLKTLPVERINKFLTMLDLIKRDLEDFMSWETSIGQANSKEEYQQLIDLESERIEKLQTQLETYKELLSDYEYGSDLYDETLNNINDVASAISQAASAQQEYNAALLNLPVDKITELNEELSHYQSLVQGQVDNQETALSAITGLLQQEMDALGKQQDEITESYDAQIEPLEKTLDLLEKSNKQRARTLALEQAKYDLAKAESQNTVQAIVNGERVYLQDIDALRSAREAVSDAEYDVAVGEIQDQIDAYEKLRDTEVDALQTEIDRLDKIKSKYEEICDIIQQVINEQAATELFGEGWQEKVLSGNDQELYDMFYDLHSSTEYQLDSLTKQIESNERIIEQTQIIIDRFNAQEMTLEEANAAINQIISLMSDGYSADEQLSTQLGMDQVSSVEEFSQQVSSQIADHMTLLQESFVVANENNLQIIEIMGTQTEKLEEIRALDEENKRLYEEMLAKIAELNARYKYHSSYDSDGGGGGGYSSSGNDRSNGTITSGMNGGSYSDDRHSSQSSSGSPSSANDDQDEDDGPGVYHRGGFVGKGNDNRKKIIKEIVTKDLKPNERYVKVEVGEGIFTIPQQDQLIKNFQNASTPYFVPVTQAQTLPNNVSRQGDINVEFNGDINLPDVRDVDGFARALYEQSSNIMRQELSKWKW